MEKVSHEFNEENHNLIMIYLPTRQSIVRWTYNCSDVSQKSIVYSFFFSFIHLLVHYPTA